MGLAADVKLVGNDFSNVTSAFSIAYLIAEVPNGQDPSLITFLSISQNYECVLTYNAAYFLQRIPAAKWLGVNIFLWGIASACHAAAFNYHSLLAARIFLGMFEASIAPCLMLISSQWYTKSEQAPRFSLWYCGLGAGQILGGIISYGFQHVRNTHFTGWQMMFVVVGLVTSLIGAATIFILPDTPMKARFLTEAEKITLLNHVTINKTGIENHHFKWSQLKEAFLDIQLWLMALHTILVSV